MRGQRTVRFLIRGCVLPSLQLGNYSILNSISKFFTNSFIIFSGNIANNANFSISLTPKLNMTNTLRTVGVCQCVGYTRVAGQKNTEPLVNHEFAQSVLIEANMHQQVSTQPQTPPTRIGEVTQVSIPSPTNAPAGTPPAQPGGAQLPGGSPQDPGNTGQAPG